MSHSKKRISDDITFRIKYLKSSLSNDPDTLAAMNKLKFTNDKEYYKELLILSNKSKVLQNIKTISKAAPIYINILNSNSSNISNDKKLVDLVNIASEVANYFGKLNLTLDDISAITDGYGSYSDLSVLSRDGFAELYDATKKKLNNIIVNNITLPNKLKPIQNKLVKMNTMMQSLSRSSEIKLIDFIYPGNVVSKLSPNLRIK